MKVHIGDYPEGDEKRIIDIQIDEWDTYSADTTLSLIALPLLKQLKDTMHGSALVDDEDVPEEIRSTSAKPKEDEWGTDEFVPARWQYVLSEILWALEQHVDYDAKNKFYDHSEVNEEDDLMDQIHSIKVDQEGLTAFEERKQNGFRLLGKYWQTMWT